MSEANSAAHRVTNELRQGRMSFQSTSKNGDSQAESGCKTGRIFTDVPAPFLYIGTSMNLVSAFAASVEMHAHKTAVFWGEREYSYSELWSASVSAGEQLK